MKIADNNTQQLIDHYFQKMVIGLAGGVSFALVIGLCLYKIGVAF